MSIPERISRRALIKGGGAAAVGLSLPGVAVARATRRHRYSHLRRSSYKPLVDHMFRVDGTPHYLRLASIHDLNAAQAGSENAFALVFRARPGASRLSHAVPTLYHPRLGTFKLLLSPGRSSTAGQPYAAIINRSHA